jgi:hypothetical protein
MEKYWRVIALRSFRPAKLTWRGCTPAASASRAGDVHRVALALFDPQPQVLALPVGIVAEDLLDDEIFRRCADATGDRRATPGEISHVRGSFEGERHYLRSRARHALDRR